MAERRNVYALRSEEAQEVLSRPPSSLILWGNTVIIITLLVSLFIADLFKLPVLAKANFVCIKAEKVTASELVVVTLETDLPLKIQERLNFPTNGKIFPQLLSNNAIDYLLFNIDSIKVVKQKVFFIGHLQSHFVTINSLGHITFVIGEESVLNTLLDKIRAF